MSWTDYSAAPAPGTAICALDKVTGVHSLTIQTEKGCFPLLVLRAGDDLRAYVNACPHQYLPLDYSGDNLLSADGTKLLCSVHGARFDIRTGEAIDGADCGLDAVPIENANGMLIIGGHGQALIDCPT
jgi:nitrite reductase/ring-hydroxylating ferredoxin subunit